MIPIGAVSIGVVSVGVIPINMVAIYMLAVGMLAVDMVAIDGGMSLTETLALAFASRSHSSVVAPMSWTYRTLLCS